MSEAGYRNKLEALDARLAQLPGAIVAFSGGVDSAMLLHAAHRVLGDAVIAVTADSPSLPRSELVEAEQFANEHGIEHHILATHELERDGYRQNASDRCYFCKTELFDVIDADIKRAYPDRAVLYGAIADDLADHRPGGRAALEHRVLAPLAEAAFTKDDVRRYSREHSLATAEKPSFACLASRIPYGTSVSADVLARLEQAEQVLRELGYRQFRVRHHDTVARIELLPDEFQSAVSRDREKIVEGVRAAGYIYVSLDLTGYRSGSMNETLP